MTGDGISLKRLPWLLCLLIVAQFALGTLGLNLPAISSANLPRIEAGLKFAKAKRIAWVRVGIGMADACAGSEVDTSAHKEFGRLASLYGRKVMLVDYTQLPNSKCVRRRILATSTSDTITESNLWGSWLQDEKAGRFQDCKNLDGIKFPGVAIGISNELVGAIEVGLGRPVDARGIENEVGNVQNKAQDERYPYAAVSGPIVAYLSQKSQVGGILAGPALEGERYDGLLQQLAAYDPAYRGRFSYCSVNWYLTTWLPGETPQTWAARCASELGSWLYNVWWPGRPVMVTELGAPGCPRELRLACLQEFNRVAPKSVSVAFWFDYDSTEWGLG